MRDEQLREPLGEREHPDRIEVRPCGAEKREAVALRGRHRALVGEHADRARVDAARREPESADDTMGTAEPPVLVLEQHLVEVEARRVIDEEGAGAVPLVEAVRRDLVTVAPVLAIAGEDQADRVARIRRLEGRPAVVVDHVVRWRGDRPDVRRRGLLAQRVADPAEGKELGHRAVRFRDEGRPLASDCRIRIASDGRTKTPTSERRRETWNRLPTTHSRKAAACSPTRARTRRSWRSSGRGTSSPTRARFARPWAGPISAPAGSGRRGRSSRGRSTSILSTTTRCSRSGCRCYASATATLRAGR